MDRFCLCARAHTKHIYALREQGIDQHNGMMKLSLLLLLSDAHIHLFEHRPTHRCRHSMAILFGANI